MASELAGLRGHVNLADGSVAEVVFSGLKGRTLDVVVYDPELPDEIRLDFIHLGKAPGRISLECDEVRRRVRSGRTVLKLTANALFSPEGRAAVHEFTTLWFADLLRSEEQFVHLAAGVYFTFDVETRSGILERAKASAVVPDAEPEPEPEPELEPELEPWTEPSVEIVPEPATEPASLPAAAASPTPASPPRTLSAVERARQAARRATQVLSGVHDRPLARVVLLEERRHARVRANVDVTMEQRGGRAAVHLSDMSACGLRFVTDATPTPGERIRITLTLKAGGRPSPVFVQGTIKWVKRSDDSKKMCGLFVEHIEDGFEGERWRRFIEASAAAGRGIPHFGLNQRLPPEITRSAG